MFARPLRRHETEQGDWNEAVPAEFAAGFNGDREDFRVEHPRSGACAGGAFKDCALPLRAPRHHSEERGQESDR